MALADGLGDAFTHKIVALDGRRDGTESVSFGGRLDFVDFTLLRSSTLNIANLRTVRRLLAQERPAVLITYNWGSIEAAIANRLLPACPHLHCEDGFTGDATMLSDPLRRRFGRRLAIGPNSRLVVPSRTLQRLAVVRWGIPENRIRYIANGVDVDHFTPSQRTVEAGFGNQPIVVGTVARLSKEKNIARLVRVASQLAGAIDLQVRIAGDGPTFESLQALVSDSGLQEVVTLMGATGDVATMLHGIDIFVLTSDSEQMPYSILEAMACGLPVVATDVGDVRRMLSEENRPFVVSAGDDETFAAHVVRLGQSVELRRRVGAANRRHVIENFSRCKMVDRYQDLLMEFAMG